MSKYSVTMSNESGELDRRPCDNAEDAKATLIAMIEECAFVVNGDTFKVYAQDG